MLSRCRLVPDIFSGLSEPMCLMPLLEACSSTACWQLFACDSRCIAGRLHGNLGSGSIPDTLAGVFLIQAHCTPRLWDTPCTLLLTPKVSRCKNCYNHPLIRGRVCRGARPPLSSWGCQCSPLRALLWSSSPLSRMDAQTPGNLDFKLRGCHFAS